MNNKRHVLFILWVLCTLTLVAQESLVDHSARVDLSFSGLGIAYELPVAEKLLVEGSLGLGAGYRINDDFNYTWYLNDPSVYGAIGLKYIYNRKARLSNNKPLKYNSGNFIGFKTKYTTETIRFNNNKETFLFAAHWGMQKRITNHLSYGFAIGLGYALDASAYKDGGSLYPDMNIRISYVIK